MDEVCGHHILCYIHGDFFFLDFYEDTLDYQLLKFDQHCSKGSKHSPVCVSKDCPKECVCMCIYIIYFKIWNFKIFFVPTTILFPSVTIIKVEIGKSKKWLILSSRFDELKNSFSWIACHCFLVLQIKNKNLTLIT